MRLAIQAPEGRFTAYAVLGGACAPPGCTPDSPEYWSLAAILCSIARASGSNVNALLLPCVHTLRLCHACTACHRGAASVPAICATLFLTKPLPKLLPLLYCCRCRAWEPATSVALLSRFGLLFRKLTDALTRAARAGLSQHGCALLLSRYAVHGCPAAPQRNLVIAIWCVHGCTLAGCWQLLTRLCLHSCTRSRQAAACSNPPPPACFCPPLPFCGRGCTGLLVASVTLVCAPTSHLKDSEWTKEEQKQLMAAREAYRRHIYLDVSGGWAGRVYRWLARRNGRGELMG